MEEATHRFNLSPRYSYVKPVTEKTTSTAAIWNKLKVCDRREHPDSFEYNGAPVVAVTEHRCGSHNTGKR